MCSAPRLPFLNTCVPPPIMLCWGAGETSHWWSRVGESGSSPKAGLRRVFPALASASWSVPTKDASTMNSVAPQLQTEALKPRSQISLPFLVSVRYFGRDDADLTSMPDIMRCGGRVLVQRPENSIWRITENALHAKMGLSGVLRPKQFGFDVEGPTYQVYPYSNPILDRKTSLETEKRPKSAIYFCLWFLSQANPLEFVDTQFLSYPVCPNQKVTVIFGFVSILSPNAISHTFRPIAALSKPSLWWGQPCFRIPWEPQCQVVTTLRLEMEKAVMWAWLAPSSWVIVETLSPDAAERAGLLMSSSVRWDPDPLTS